MTCSEAFDLYRRLFKKSYIFDQLPGIMEIFCRNYADLQYTIDVLKCQHCGLTPHLDRDFATLSNAVLPKHHDLDKLRRLTDEPGAPKNESCWNNLCQSYPCSLNTSIPPGTTYYNRIDLREARVLTRPKDQGYCGSCWAFALTAVLENAVLNDITLGLAKQKPFWNFTDKTLNLSDQYALSNIWGLSAYCHGGNAQFGINGLACAWKSVELEKNFQYDVNKFEPYWKNGTTWKLSVPENDYYIPFKITQVGYFDVFTGTTYYPVGQTKIHDGTGDGSMLKDHPEAIVKAKQYLSSGIAVLGMVWMSGYGPFMHATSDFIADRDCPSSGASGKDHINHQILYVGYGKVNGTDVWIVRNSWGDNWGAGGYFYIPVKGNIMCYQYLMTVSIPSLFDEKTYRKIPPGRQKKGVSWLDQEEVLLINPDTNETTKYTGQIESYFDKLEQQPQDGGGTTGDNTGNSEDSGNSTSGNDDKKQQAKDSAIIVPALLIASIIAIIIAIAVTLALTKQIFRQRNQQYITI